MKNLYILVLLSLLLIQCKKQLDPISDNIGSPEFFVSGKLEDTAFNFASGCNNYYMETDFAKRTPTGGNSPYTLKGYLSPKDSIAYPNSITLMVTSYNFDTVDADFNIDSVFYVGRKIKVSSDSVLNLDVNKINHALVLYSAPNLTSVIYLSSTIRQSSYMDIKSVEKYGVNSKGQKTIKVSFDIVCKVSDYTYTPVKDFNVSGTFAFAYPS